MSILVVTSDRDLGDTKPFPGIKLHEALPYKNKVDVMYGEYSKQEMQELFRLAEPTTVYLNSMFSMNFTLTPLTVVKDFPDIKIVLAPRGMLNENALKIKRLKKKVFLGMFRWLGVHRRIKFHATDENEALRIKKVFGSKSTILSNVPYPVGEHVEQGKEVDTLKLVCSSRVSPEKNIKAIFEYLKELNPKYSIEFTLIGNPEKQDYWNDCKRIIAQLPENIKVNSLGALPKEEALQHLSKADVFILPTLGENFGHSIYEAFTKSKPVIISNLTPWTALEGQGIGYDLSLDEPHKFVNAIESFASMDSDTYQQWSKRAYEFARNFEASNDLLPAYEKLFARTQ